MNAPIHAPDLSRTLGHLDQVLLASTRITIIGVGGAANLARHLARCGVGSFSAIDPDSASLTNMATQAYDLNEVGQPKVESLTKSIERFNPTIRVDTFACRYEDLPPDTLHDLWSTSNLALGMTDQHATQMRINADALKYGVPTIFAMMGDGLQQAEVTATLPDAVASGLGCSLCQTWSRVKAYQDGFVNPAIISSHAVSAELLNAQIAYIALGLLHHFAESSLPITRIGARFAQSPCLLTQLDPGFWDQNPDAYGVIPPDMGLFTTKLFPLDSPRGWICEACGTAGVA